MEVCDNFESNPKIIRILIVSQLILHDIINELKSAYMLDWNENEDDWQSYMQYFITSEFINQSYNFGREYLDMVIDKHLDRLTKENHINLTKEAVRRNLRANEIARQYRVIPEDDDFEEIKTECREANFEYIQDLLHRSADFESSKYQQHLEGWGDEYEDDHDEDENENENEDENENDENDHYAENAEIDDDHYEEDQINITSEQGQLINIKYDIVNLPLSNFFKELIKNFDLYNIDENHLPVMAFIYQAVKNPGKYNINRYLKFNVELCLDEPNFNYNEVLMDDEGFCLITGGFIKTSDNKGSIFRNEGMIVFPNDELETSDITLVIDNFIAELKRKLESPLKRIGSSYFGDGIEKMYHFD